jgi:2-polyprenyl-3-methyl-5-hydroxy-6-metoxy-1,4-benzoquinol methylase
MINEDNIKWEQAQEWERQWWSNCGNTLWEDVKQMALAPYLGLKIIPNAYTNYRIPLNGESVLDIGGGPSSLLLKCENVRGTVVDPCDYPEWVSMRYEEVGIGYLQMRGEDIPILAQAKGDGWDEVWIYNVLQHVQNPELVIKNALRVGKLIRIFEWINTGIVPGHPHSFSREQLEGWLGGQGQVVKLSSNGLFGTAFYGIFKGGNYGKSMETN